MKYEKLVNEIISAVGGKENIDSVVHCATRLRFALVDEDKADDAAVNKINGVLSLVKSGGQYQLVIGNHVDEVYKELVAIADIKKTEYGTKKSNKKVVDKILGAITGSIAPVIPLLAGCGMGKVLLLVLSMSGLLLEDSQTYIMLDMIFDTGFYFMPAFVGYSSAKMFGANEYLGAFLGLCLVNPTWTGIVSEKEPFEFLGIGVQLVKYTSSLVPVLMSVWIMSYIERFAKKVVPEMIKVFAEPLLVALISVPLAFIVIAPIGNVVSQFVATGSMFLYDHFGIAAIAILAAFYPWLVSVGIHKALSPISISLVAEQGFDPVIRVVALCSNMSQAAACMAVSFKTKNRDLKSLAFSSSLTAFLGGITEPAMYGINLRLKRPMYAAMIGAAVAGLFAGLMKLKAFIYVTPGILSLAMWVSKEENFFFVAVITLIIASVVTFIATLVLGFDDSEFYIEEEPPVMVSTKSNQKLLAPVKGKIVQQENINDATFSSGVMGKGIAITPENGEIIAPCDATVTATFESKHAIGLTTENGVEILIHVGIDTVAMEGKGFESFVNKGEHVKQGDLLLKFDRDQIKEAGYEDTTIVMITNTQEFLDVISTPQDSVDTKDELLTVLV